MKHSVEQFYESLENPDRLSRADLIERFVYFLTVKAGRKAATAKAVGECFTECHLAVPTNIASRLREGLKSSPRRYVRMNGGYKLEHHRQKKLLEKLKVTKVAEQTNATLRNLKHKVPAGNAREFLEEAIKCSEAGANRATIIMVWILAIDHFSTYVFEKKLEEFNAQLTAKKGSKAKLITHRGDLAEMNESKFIENCRDAKIINKDVWKILNTNLEHRNSCAHPSDIEVPKSKVVFIVEDLVVNVIFKFKI